MVQARESLLVKTIRSPMWPAALSPGTTDTSRSPVWQRVTPAVAEGEEVGGGEEGGRRVGVADGVGEAADVSGGAVAGVSTPRPGPVSELATPATTVSNASTAAAAPAVRANRRRRAPRAIRSKSPGRGASGW